MTEPFARITNYNGLVEALRARQARLELSDETLDDVAGLTRGHTNKVLGPSRDRGIGSATLEAYLMALAIDLLVVENKQKLKQMRPHYEGRAASHVRTEHPIGKVVLSRAMSRLGQQRMAMLTSGERAYFASIGGRSRATALSPEQRQSIARKGARVRWERHKAKAKAATAAEKAPGKAA
jgi:hypothetical protein